MIFFILLKRYTFIGKLPVPIEKNEK